MSGADPRLRGEAAAARSRQRAALWSLAVLPLLTSCASRDQTTFETAGSAEAIATISVRCDTCAWEIEGREGVVLAIALDDRPLQHLPVVRSGRADYRVLLGSVQRGSHTVRILEDATLTSRELSGRRAAVVEDIAIEQIAAASPDYKATALAPIVYARPNTVGRFTDVPLFMWYEIEPTPRGTRYRYSVIFTNEDGGTPADRLMATWGRTTDIEYVYSVEVSRDAAILDEDMQGPKHEILPFRGRREGEHPLLWVTTDNNMVLDQGTTVVRYAPAPTQAQLTDVSREVVMDGNPWLYEVMTKELTREGKIKPDAEPGNGTIPDPRRFVYIEGCGELHDNALGFAVNVGDRWLASDRGGTQYRIARDGCFRAAIPLPGAARPNDVRGLRVQAFERSSKTATGPVQFRRVNAVFGLDDRFVPAPSVFKWRGSAELGASGPPLELVIR